MERSKAPAAARSRRPRRAQHQDDRPAGGDDLPRSDAGGGRGGTRNGLERLVLYQTILIAEPSAAFSAVTRTSTIALITASAASAVMPATAMRLVRAEFDCSSMSMVYSSSETLPLWWRASISAAVISSFLASDVAKSRTSGHCPPASLPPAANIA